MEKISSKEKRKAEEEFNATLIRMVEQNPILYHYKNKRNAANDTLRENVWEAIAIQLNEPVAKCKRRWKNLRDTYVKWLKKGEKNREYLTNPFYIKFTQTMSFLKQFYTEPHNHSNSNQKKKSNSASNAAMTVPPRFVNVVTQDMINALLQEKSDDTLPAIDKEEEIKALVNNTLLQSLKTIANENNQFVPVPAKRPRIESQRYNYEIQVIPTNYESVHPVQSLTIENCDPVKQSIERYQSANCTNIKRIKQSIVREETQNETITETSMVGINSEKHNETHPNEKWKQETHNFFLNIANYVNNNFSVEKQKRICERVWSVVAEAETETLTAPRDQPRFPQ